MREIKFRAWDKVDKKMKNVTCLDFADWWVATGYKEGERNSFNNTETDRHILMQYTGLKDKNGKEIYEGDIVRCYQKGQTIVEVIIFEDGCYFIEFSNKQKAWIDGAIKQFKAELIGNIYENPELLQEVEKWKD